MFIQSLISKLQSDAALAGQVRTAVILLAVLPLGIHVLIKGRELLIELIRYFEFFCQHTEFYKKSEKKPYRTIFMRLPFPWPTENTYYLLDHEPMRKLFARSPNLDAFALARRLHYVVWQVPPLAYKDTLREAAKKIHVELSAKKLGPVTRTFEDVLRADIASLKKKVGNEGRLVPFHTTFYRMAYAGNMKAIYGPNLPVTETRIALQNFAINLYALNATPSLPVLPTEWWNRIFPASRKGAQARDDVTNALIKWQQEGGLETCSDTWRNIMQVVLDKNVPIVHSNRWVNMVLFGFQGNTGEQPGWAFLHILQSPKLWAAIQAEVDALPPDLLTGTDFRRVTPLLYSSIHETLRLSTAVFAGRQATIDTKIQGCDTLFPKGSLIRTMSRASAFDDRIWGADADCFKGDRFLLNENLYKEELFFGGGVSACPGRHFALAELELLMAHIIREFEFDHKTLEMHKKLPPEAKDLELAPKVDSKFSCDIIDLDGTKIKGVHPGVADVDYRMESVSGSLYPLQESTCFIKPRY
ncbi:putative cytochrome p450 [Phaeomoniella chlamydospora]|uniref:Putative cytochrome p450 n=1 Tax=Phaeomoniella chlamydospora TaxID=158046 RepID=A0A0G2EGI1_PHACM|nr:putative cytochrome p450 [Phaeomoniella chlamydospora]